MALSTIMPDAERVTKALASQNKLASEILRQATALQARLQMMEQVGWLPKRMVMPQEESKIQELNKLGGRSSEVETSVCDVCLMCGRKRKRMMLHGKQNG